MLTLSMGMEFVFFSLVNFLATFQWGKAFFGFHYIKQLFS